MTIRESTTTMELYKIWWYHVVPYFQTNQYVLYIYVIICTYVTWFVCLFLPLKTTLMVHDFVVSRKPSRTSVVPWAAARLRPTPDVSRRHQNAPRNWLSMKQGFSTLKPCRWIPPLLAPYYSTMNLNIKLFQIKFAGLLSSVVRIRTICMQEFSACIEEPHTIWTSMLLWPAHLQILLPVLMILITLVAIDHSLR